MTARTLPAVARPGRRRKAPPAKTDWQPAAAWYDGLVGDEGSEFHRAVVLPGTLRLLGEVAGQAVLDIACGQGVLCRLLHAQGARPVGFDAAADLIEAARERSDPAIAYHIADARTLADAPWLERESFDAAACVLAIQNVDKPRPVFEAAARALRPGGRLVVVMMHPAFRSFKQSGWGWDEASATQYRRIDRYLLPRREPIVTHPGRGGAGGYTWSFHRPIGAYVKALAQSGLLTDALEEWPSHKTSQPGGRAAAENTARAEIPMFLALRAVKAAACPAGRGASSSGR